MDSIDKDREDDLFCIRVEENYFFPSVPEGREDPQPDLLEQILGIGGGQRAAEGPELGDENRRQPLERAFDVFPHGDRSRTVLKASMLLYTKVKFKELTEAPAGRFAPPELLRPGQTEAGLGGLGLIQKRRQRRGGRFVLSFKRCLGLDREELVICKRDLSP